MATQPRVAIARLGRTSASGEVGRADHWRRLFTAAGADVIDVPLLQPGRRPRPHLRDVALLARGEVVPETFAWDPRSAESRLRELAPTLTVIVTARAFHPALLAVAPSVFDFGDRLSVSYRDRAAIGVGLVAGTGLRLLARFQRRRERHSVHALAVTAAGYADARVLGCQWIPSTVIDHAAISDAGADHDLGFVGTLDFAPNVEAVRRLARMWPALTAHKPDASLLIAGARPTAEIQELCRRHGWTVMADFDSIESVYSRFRLAVTPLDHASGIQHKVLDPAILGVAQVVSPVVLNGFAPGFPVMVGHNDDEFVAATLALLDDPERRRHGAAELRSHMQKNYTVAAWVDAARAWLRAATARV